MEKAIPVIIMSHKSTIEVGFPAGEGRLAPRRCQPTE
jgi:hypothetical protein